MSAELADDELLITRSFDAPAALMFELWSDPEHFKNWMGPEGFECDEVAMDFRVGGAYRAVIRSTEYGDSWFGGVYREIDPPKRLVFTFKWDSGPSSDLETLVTITFEERDGKTTQLFHQTPFVSLERRDSHIGGWQSSFDKLDVYAKHLARERTS